MAIVLSRQFSAPRRGPEAICRRRPAHSQNITQSDHSGPPARPSNQPPRPASLSYSLQCSLAGRRRSAHVRRRLRTPPVAAGPSPGAGSRGALRLIGAARNGHRSHHAQGAILRAGSDKISRAPPSSLWSLQYTSPRSGSGRHILLICRFVALILLALRRGPRKPWQSQHSLFSNRASLLPRLFLSLPAVRQHRDWRAKMRFCFWLYCAESAAWQARPAYAAARFCRLPRRHAVTVGLLANTRGLTELLALRVGPCRRHRRSAALLACLS